eukprot:311854-Chlamydomonas_euryale.AAC.1
MRSAAGPRRGTTSIRLRREAAARSCLSLTPASTRRMTSFRTARAAGTTLACQSGESSGGGACVAVGCLGMAGRAACAPKGCTAACAPK